MLFHIFKMAISKVMDPVCEILRRVGAMLLNIYSSSPEIYFVSLHVPVNMTAINQITF